MPKINSPGGAKMDYFSGPSFNPLEAHEAGSFNPDVNSPKLFDNKVDKKYVGQTKHDGPFIEAKPSKTRPFKDDLTRLANDKRLIVKTK